MYVTLYIYQRTNGQISMDKSSRQKINKETLTLNDKIDQLNVLDIKRTLYPKIAEKTFFSSAHGAISRIDHILGQKTNLNKFKRTEIILSILFPHNNRMKLKINTERKR